jgi:hypothetical protein
MSAGDYWLFRSGNAQIRNLETAGQFAKGRHWRPFLRVSAALSLSDGLPGWGGRILTSESPDPNPLKEREFYAP